jgi:hypothetical protein
MRPHSKTTHLAIFVRFPPPSPQGLLLHRVVNARPQPLRRSSLSGNDAPRSRGELRSGAGVRSPTSALSSPTFWARLRNRFGSVSGRAAFRGRASGPAPSGARGLEHIGGKLPEPIVQIRRIGSTRHQRRRKRALRHMNAELPVCFELFFVVELVKR